MKDYLIPSGITVVLIGILIIFIGALSNYGSPGSKFAVGGFVGPIPFGFGNDKPLVYILIAVSAFVALLFLIIDFFQK